MYRPQPIKNRNFQLKKETLAILSNAEQDFVRTDYHIKYSPYTHAVRKTLTRSDALGAQNMIGCYPKIYTLMKIEAIGFILENESDIEEFPQHFGGEEQSSFDSSIATYRYMKTSEWLTNSRNCIKINTPQDLLGIYDRLEGKGSHETPRSSFRKVPYQADDSCLNVSYIPPAGIDLELLLQDFCDFITSDYLTPFSQAAVAQFQLEALKPFDNNLDQMERLIVHYILGRRHLLKNISIPLNLPMMQFEKQFHKHIKTYRTSWGFKAEDVLCREEGFIRYMAEMSQETLQFTISLHKVIASLVDSWKMRLGKIEKGSATELLLYEFAGTPVMTTNQAKNLINKSFSTTSNAIKYLESANILRSGKPVRRNKTFEAPDAILIHDAMYQKRAKTTHDLSHIT